MARDIRKPGAKKTKPSKLTPEVRELICEAVRAGNYKATAAKLAGVDRGSVDNWERWGEADPDSIYGEFLKALKAAEAEAEAGSIAVIMRAAAEGGDWHAAAWVARHRWPQRWRGKSFDEDERIALLKEQHTKLQLENEKLRLENDQLRSGGSDATITIVIPPVPDESE